MFREVEKLIKSIPTHLKSIAAIFRVFRFTFLPSQRTVACLLRFVQVGRTIILAVLLYVIRRLRLDTFSRDRLSRVPTYIRRRSQQVDIQLVPLWCSGTFLRGIVYARKPDFHIARHSLRVITV